MRSEDYIRRALDQQYEEIKAIQRSLSLIESTLAGLKVKASVWGAMAGMLPALAAILYSLVASCISF